MVSCPRCDLPLEVYPVLRGQAFRCESCDGLMIDGPALRSIAGDDRVGDIMWRAAKAEPSSLVCAGCGIEMRSIRMRDVVFEICPHDELFWFDGGELAGFRPGLRDQTLADPRGVIPKAGTGGRIFAILDQLF